MSKLERKPLGTGMVKNRTREDLRKDILMGFGAPIINVELTNDHLDQAINQALKQFWMHHRDGSYESYNTYVVTATDAQRGWIKIPETMDSVVNVIHLGNTGVPEQRVYTGHFGAEVQSELDAIIAAGGSADPHNEANDPPTDTATSGSPTLGNTDFHLGMINAYQMQGQNTPYGFTTYGNGPGSASSGSYVGGSLRINPGAFNQISFADYQSMKQNMDNMKSILGTGTKQHKMFEYARYQRRLYLLFRVNPGDGLCIKAFENVDPELNPEFGEVFDDETLKNLAQGYAKQMWGSVLRKFGQVVLIGGVTLDGQALYDEASEEINAILEKLTNEQPTDFLFG